MYLDLSGEKKTGDGLDNSLSSRLGTFASLLRDSGLFSFKGKLGRKKYWLALLWAHLLPLLAILPLVGCTIAAALLDLWRLAALLQYLDIVVAGVLHYWILSAAIVKRLRDLNLSPWTALIYLAAPAMAAVNGRIEGMHGYFAAMCATRYLWATFSMAVGWASLWEGLKLYLTPYFFPALLILQGLISGTSENAPRKKLIVAFVALALIGGSAEAAYDRYGVYRGVSPDDGLRFVMYADRLWCGQIYFEGIPGEEIKVRIDSGFRTEPSEENPYRVDNCTLVLIGAGGKEIEVPLANKSVVAGWIETRDFGTLKLGRGVFREAFQPGIYATRSQMAKLRAFLQAHQ